MKGNNKEEKGLNLVGISETTEKGKEKKELSVQELLKEHMDYMAIRAGRETGEKRKGIIEDMENLQILMNRLKIPDGKRDSYLDGLTESHVFLRLSYDSKVLILEHTLSMDLLRDAMDRYINYIEGNYVCHGEESIEDKKKMVKRLRRTAGWRLFRLFVRLPWGY